MNLAAKGDDSRRQSRDRGHRGGASTALVFDYGPGMGPHFGQQKQQQQQQRHQGMSNNSVTNIQCLGYHSLDGPATSVQGDPTSDHPRTTFEPPAPCWDLSVALLLPTTAKMAGPDWGSPWSTVTKITGEQADPQRVWCPRYTETVGDGTL